MFAFIPVIYPPLPLLVGAGAGAAVTSACSKSGGGKKKAQIEAHRARIEALERTP